MKEQMFARRDPDHWEIQGVLGATGLPAEDLSATTLSFASFRCLQRGMAWYTEEEDMSTAWWWQEMYDKAVNDTSPSVLLLWSTTNGQVTISIVSCSTMPCPAESFDVHVFHTAAEHPNQVFLRASSSRVPSTRKEHIP